MGNDREILDLIKEQVMKELNRLHTWLEEESRRITQLDKDSAVDAEKLKAELKEHFDEKLTAMEAKLEKLIREATSGQPAALGNKEKAAIGGGVGLGALALIKHIIDMIWGSGAAG